MFRVSFACSPLTFTATMPLAAKETRTSSCVTTAFATSSTASLRTPVLEKRFLLGETSGRRPGDVTIPCWRNSKGLAVDVAVTSTFSRRNLSLPSPADTYGLRKHAKYEEGFRGTSYLFCAAVLETTGGYSEEAVSFFRQLFRFAARQQNTKLCVYAGRAWARVACNLQASVAQAILNRVPTGGHSERGRRCLQAGSGAQQRGVSPGR